MTRQTGIVEKVDYTFGGAGNQFTTIGGVRYVTFFDLRTADWRVGDTVQFHAFNAPLYSGEVPLAQANCIRKVAT